MSAKLLVARLIRLLYRAMTNAQQEQTIAFLSRQSPRPYDFVQLEPELRKRLPDFHFEWACVPKGGQLSPGLFLQQLRLVATAKVCLVDGYVPAVSIPQSHRGACVQVWHASGAVKKFGYQCLDTPAGRSSEDARAFRMHKGYDCVVAGLPGALPAFSAGFGMDKSLILPLGLPRLDYLLSSENAAKRQSDAQSFRKAVGAAEGERVVLYAPTFRKGNANANWLSVSLAALSKAFAEQDVRIVLAGHPLDANLQRDMPRAGGAPVIEAPCGTLEALPGADMVISDYSSVALDAGAMGLPVLFYVPDIDEYRLSPGLNIDPLVEFPEDAFVEASELALHARSVFAQEGALAASVTQEGSVATRQGSLASKERSAPAQESSAVAQQGSMAAHKGSFAQYVAAYAAGVNTQGTQAIADLVEDLAHASQASS